jgi:hypothetical protein
LLCWTLLVAIGVAWELGAEAADKSRRKKPRLDRLAKLNLDPDHKVPIRKPIPRKRFWWIRIFEILAATLVVGGVGGELYIAAYVPVAESRLRTLSDSLVAQTTLSAARANERAGDISDRADKLAEILKTERRELEMVVAELTAEQKSAAADAANLEAEKKKRAELAASLLPIDQTEASLRIRRIPGQSLIFEFISEHEPQRIAEEIHFVFSGWKVFRRRANESLIPDGIDICIGAKPPIESLLFIDPDAPRREYSEQRGATEAAANALLDGLRRSGIDAQIAGPFCRANELSPSPLLVRIGTKPNHVLEQTLNELGSKLTMIGKFAAGSNRALIPDESTEPGKGKP